MSYEIQLQWIRNLHAFLRSPNLDVFFQVWNIVDTIYFSALVITLVWYLKERHIGIRLFYILLINSIINTLLKIVFDQPRPCQLDSSIGILCFSSPGFPSGAAQTAALWCGLIFIESKNALYRCLGLLFAVILCFSRIYLGVHFPTDIIGGLIVGSLLLLVYKKVFPLFEKSWKIASVIFSFLIVLLGLSLSPVAIWLIYFFFLTLGFAVGLLICEQKTTLHISMRTRCYQTGIVLAGLSVLFALECALPQFKMLFVFIKGYWLSFGGWLMVIRPLT